MKKPVLQLTAIAIGLAASLAAFNFLKKTDVPTSTDGTAYSVIGEIQSVDGQVERRLPRSTNMESVPSPRPLYSQDLIITQKGSSAVLVFESVQTTLKLSENTRFIAELDATKPGGLVATLLDGNAQVLNPGKPGLFRLFREGHEVKLTELDQTRVPVIPQVNSNDAKPPNNVLGNFAGSETPVPLNGLVISATLPDEPVGSTPVQKAPEPQVINNEILTNEDIVRQLKTQTGFFQRCYLNYIHRSQKPNAPLGGKIGQAGTITVSFVIQSNGKVNETKVVRSDFQDTTLQNCIMEVIGRTVFRGFTGSPVPVLEFPIGLQ